MHTPTYSAPEGALTGKKTFVNSKPGKHRAWLYRMEDFGTQPNYFDPTAKPQRKLRLGFELPDQLMEDGKPVIIMTSVTHKLWSKGDKQTKLVKWLDSWFDGEAFDDTIQTDFGFIENFNWGKMYEVPCEVTVEVSEKGSSYITNIRRVKNETGLPVRVNPILELDLHEEGFSRETFSKLSDNTQSEIMSSPEYKALSDAQKKPFDKVEKVMTDNTTTDDVFKEAEEAMTESTEVPF